MSGSWGDVVAGGRVQFIQKSDNKLLCLGRDHLSVIDLDPGTRRVTGHRSLSLSQCDMVRPLIIDVLQCSLFTREGHHRGTVGRIWQHLVVKLHDLGEHF